MRIPMLHTSSAAGPVSSLIGESSSTAQTEMHTNEVPKHVPRAIVTYVLLANVFTAVEELWEGFETEKGLPWEASWVALCSFFG